MVDSLGPFLKVPFRSHHVGGPTHELMPNLFALRLEHYSEQHVYNHNQSGQRQRRSHRHEKTFHHSTPRLDAPRKGGAFLSALTAAAAPGLGARPPQQAQPLE